MSEQPFQPRPPRRIGGDGKPAEPPPFAAGPFGERLRIGRSGRAGPDGDGARRTAASVAAMPDPHAEAPRRRLRIPLGYVAALAIGGLLAGALVVLFWEPGLIERTVGEAEPAAVEPYGLELRDGLPETPRELVAASPIYDLRAPAGTGEATITLALTTPTQDARNLGAYTWTGTEWRRIGDVELALDGSAARAAVAEVPANIAVLRRSRFSSIIAGRLPRDQEAAAQVVEALTIAHPQAWRPGGDGSLLDGPSRDVARQFTPAAAGAGLSIWPSLAAGLDETDVVNEILSDDFLRRAHISAIQFAVQSGGYQGVDVDYSRVSPSLRDEFSAFIADLAANLRRNDRGLSVHVPIPPGGAFEASAYDVGALGAAADFIVVEPPVDPTLFEQAIADSAPALLEAVEPQRLLLALRSDAVVRSAGGLARISQREALRLASLLSVRERGPYPPSSSITLQADSLLIDNSSTGLHWDEEARAVSFSYPAEGGTVTVWIENRFSAAFKLLAVAEHGFGGIHLGNISADPSNAFLWPAVEAFFRLGSPDLRYPNPALFIPIFDVEAGILSGSAAAGRQAWQLPPRAGEYEARVVVGDGDVRVGHVIAVEVGG